ncbi:hypothetical protein BpHYR1_042233 [Brachionus plicatilis]|uniref:Uncharacterized protein n=1 Tax=Brachionus plicatilis TaxID=10195 RepID=A0A3M7PEY1_BRAPC|nr:hypothetical protein BpHYR1_042233 [Brachionus plicatilis]
MFFQKTEAYPILMLKERAERVLQISSSGTVYTEYYQKIKEAKLKLPRVSIIGTLKLSGRKVWRKK